MSQMMVCLVFMLSLFVSVGQSASPTTADGIIQKCAAAYQSLKSYVGTTTVHNRFEIGSQVMNQTASARIQFVRPQNIRIEGKGTSGTNFTIVSNDKDTWLRWSLRGNTDDFERQQDISMAVASMTGVGGRAPTVIPALLLKLNWGYPFLPGTSSLLKGQEKIDGFKCYKITSHTAIDTKTMWIDTKTFLLRQLKEEMSAKQMATVQEQSKEAMKQMGKEMPEMPEVTIKAFHTLHSFRIEKINGKVAAKLFEDPTNQPKEGSKDRSE